MCDSTNLRPIDHTSIRWFVFQLFCETAAGFHHCIEELPHRDLHLYITKESLGVTLNKQLQSSSWFTKPKQIKTLSCLCSHIPATSDKEFCELVWGEIPVPSSTSVEWLLSLGNFRKETLLEIRNMAMNMTFIHLQDMNSRLYRLF